MKILLITAILLASSACEAKRTRFTPRYASLDVEGTIEIEPRGVSLTSSNELKDLGIEDSEGAFLPRLDVDWQNFHVIAIGYDVEWDGDGVATADLELGNGEIITVGTPVSSLVDYSISTVNLFWDLFPKRIPFEVGLGFGLGFLDYDVRVAEISGSTEIATSEELPFGCLSARFAKELGNWELNLILQGIEFEFDDDEYQYWGGEAAVYYQITDGRVGIGAMGGVIFQHIELSYTSRGSTTDAEADVFGPFLGLVLTL